MAKIISDYRYIVSEAVAGAEARIAQGHGENNGKIFLLTELKKLTEQLESEVIIETDDEIVHHLVNLSRVGRVGYIRLAKGLSLLEAKNLYDTVFEPKVQKLREDLGLEEV